MTAIKGGGRLISCVYRQERFRTFIAMAAHAAMLRQGQEGTDGVGGDVMLCDAQGGMRNLSTPFYVISL